MEKPLNGEWPCSIRGRWQGQLSSFFHFASLSRWAGWTTSHLPQPSATIYSSENSSKDPGNFEGNVSRWSAVSINDSALMIWVASVTLYFVIGGGRSVTKWCPTLWDPMDGSTPGLPVLHYLPELAQTHVHGSGMPSNHLILCRPLLLLPSVFPSIRVFSSEAALRIQWLKYWSFSFSISPSNKYSGLISFRVNWILVTRGNKRGGCLNKPRNGPPAIVRTLLEWLL